MFIYKYHFWQDIIWFLMDDSQLRLRDILQFAYISQTF